MFSRETERHRPLRLATRLKLQAAFPAPPAALQVPLPTPFEPANAEAHFAFPDDLRAPKTDLLQLYWQTASVKLAQPHVFTVSNDGRSRYDGLLVQFSRPMAARGMAIVSYTLVR